MKCGNPTKCFANIRFSQSQSYTFQKGIPMLFLAVQKGFLLPFKKGTFFHHFKSWRGGGHLLTPPVKYGLTAIASREELKFTYNRKYNWESRRT